MTEQKFDSLCTLADKLGVRVSINIQSYGMQIRCAYDDGEDYSGDWQPVDQALTDALRYLRKIKTKQ